MITLHSLPASGRKSKRLGRGISAGQGKSAGRGTKGQKARTGFNIPAGFEGGQTKIFMRLPKLRGGRFPHRPKPTTITLTQLEKTFQDNEQVSLKTLKQHGLVDRSARGAKVVATGTLTKKLRFRGLSFSSAAHTQLITGKQQRSTKASG
ncbi:MAG: 50S ribosomal protein L15 [Patescibacteria group bacterium]